VCLNRSEDEDELESPWGVENADERQDLLGPDFLTRSQSYAASYNARDVKILRRHE
jgi:hypothetical protein